MRGSAAGFVVIGLGVTPAVEYLAGTGLVEKGAVPVDEGMQTRAPDIYAAGDIAAVPDADWERRRVEHWVVAQRQGQRAARGMLGRDPGPVEIDFFWSQAGGGVPEVRGTREGVRPDRLPGSRGGRKVPGRRTYRKGVLKAAATIGMPLDLVAVERLMRFGAAPSAAQLEDPGFDLMAEARKVRRR